MRRFFSHTSSLRWIRAPGATPALAAALLLMGFQGAAAQGRLVDEGQFRILIAGREVGKEVFTLRTQGTGPDLRFTAQGTLTADLPAESIQMTTTLATLGTDRMPDGYEVKVSGDRMRQVTIRRQGPRYVYRVTSAAGQEVREARVPPDAVILESMVSHHFHFVVFRFLEGQRSVSPLDAATRRPVQLTLETRDPTTFTLDGRQVPVERLRVQAEDGFWDVWYDAAGKIMRVENPLAGFRSERISAQASPS